MANTTLEEVILYGPLHQVIVDRCAGDTLVVLDSLVVVALKSGQVGRFEVMLVGKTRKLSEVRPVHR